MVPPAASLVERDVELEAISAALAERGSGRLVVIEGPPGIGKSALLAEARTMAERAGGTVLTAQASPLERDLDFGVARQLLDPGVVDGLLTPAAEGEQGRAEGGEPSYERYHSLLTALAGHDAAGGLVLCVDDLQWADAPSVRWLAFAAERSADIAALLVVATRPLGRHQRRHASSAPLRAVVEHPRSVLLRPAPLTDVGARVLVRDALGGEATGPFVRACLEVSGGHPAHLRGLLAALDAAAVEPDEQHVERVAELAGPALATVVERQLHAAGEEAAALARAMTVLGGAGAAETAALAGLDAAEARTAAGLLADEGLLADGAGWRLASPAVTRAVEATIDASEWARLHTAAAEVLDARGAPIAAIARHLLHAPPAGDATVAALLTQAADAALPAGRAAALELLDRAIAEPPAPAALARVLLRRAEVAVELMRPDAVAAARAAVAAAKSHDQRARAALVLARGLLSDGDPRDGVRVLREAAEELGGRIDEELAATLDVALVEVARWDIELHRYALARLERWRDDATGDSVARLAAFAHLGHEDTLACRPASEAVSLARGALADGRLIERFGEHLVAAVAAIQVLHAADLVAESGRQHDALLRATERAGSPLAHALALTSRGACRAAAGLLVEAEADAEQALVGDHGRDAPFVSLIAHSTLLRVAVERDDLELASRRAVLAVPGELPHLTIAARLLTWRGALRLGQGRLEEALADLLAAGERQQAAGIEYQAFAPWRAYAVTVLVALGDRERAQAIAEDELASARRHGVASGIGRALRSRAAVESGRARVDLLRESLDALTACPARLELARTQLELGLELGGAAGRKLTYAAQRLADGSGAEGLARRARAALGGDPGRPAGPAALTPSERRTVELAVAGLSNRELAEALFVSPKTVETHLTSAFRKLAIRSRHQLADALGRHGEPAA